MYPRNATTPPRIAVGPVIAISDGSLQTTGVSVVVRPEGGPETAGAGTLEVSTTTGVWYYTPVQSETNYVSFTVTVYKANCIPSSVTIVTTESAVAGPVKVDTLSAQAKADVNAEVVDVVQTDCRLHLLLSQASTLNTDININSVVGQIMDNGTTWTYDRTTDSLEAIKDSALDKTTWTDARAAKIDYLVGTVATQADDQGITQAQRVRLLPPPAMERPDSGSSSFRVWIYAYNEKHEAEDLDSIPTVTAENNLGQDRSANLGSVIKPASTTGQYYVDYTVSSDHAIEGLVIKCNATEGGITTQYAAPTWVVDTTAVDFTAADRASLEAIKAKTDQLTITAGNVHSSAQVVADKTGYSLTAAYDRAKTALAVSEYTAPPSAATVADAVWDEPRSQHTTSGTYGAVSEWAGGSGGGMPPGAYLVTVTVRNANTLAPIPGAVVRLSHPAMATRSATTGGNGTATLTADGGTWSLRVTAALYQGHEQTLVVDGDETVTVDITPITLPSSEPGFVTGYATTYSQVGTPESGVSVSLQLARLPSSSVGIIGDSAIQNGTSDVNGLVPFTGLVPGALYRVRRGSGTWTYITVPESATDPFQLTSFLGID